MQRLIHYISSVKEQLVPALLVTILAMATGCNLNQGAGEQMVNLEKVSDDPAAQLQYLNAAIAKNKQVASLYSRRAKLLLQNGQYAKALVDVNEALQLDKNDISNLFLKAQVLRAMGNIKEALAFALKAERNSYQSVALYILLSDLYLQLQQPKVAAVYTAKAFKLAPHNEYTLYYKGRVAGATGDTARAVYNYKMALKEAPEFAEARRDLAGVLVSQGQLEEARQQLGMAKKQLPNDGLLWYYQGQFYQGIQKPDSALWSYQKAIALADTMQKAHYQAGMILFARGDNPGTISHLEQAAKGYSNNAKYITTLASAYERTGQNIKALEQYQRLVALQPGYTFAHQSIARLKAKLTRPMPVVADTATIFETENNNTSQ